MNIKGGKVEGEGVGWKKLLCKTLSRKYIKNTVDVDYYSVGGSNHLKNSLSIYFLQKFTLFIAVSHARGTDQGVGSNSTPTIIFWQKKMKKRDKNITL